MTSYRIFIDHISHNGNSKFNWNMCVKGNPVRLGGCLGNYWGDGVKYWGGDVSPHPPGFKALARSAAEGCTAGVCGRSPQRGQGAEPLVGCENGHF